MAHEERKSLRLGIELLGEKSWYGGVAYLTGILGAVRLHAPPTLHLVALQRKPGVLRPEFRSLVNEVVSCPPARRRGPARMFQKLVQGFTGRDPTWDRTLEEARIDVVAFSSSGLRSRLPMVSYLPDFQHLHHPEMFSPRERKQRDSLYSRIADRTSHKR